MRSKLFHLAIITVFGAASAFSQTAPRTVSQLPEIEPFKIASGSSFSASTPQTKEIASRNFGEPKIGGNVISADFADALAVIGKNHVDGKRLDYRELTKSSLTAMLRTLDPHSNYFDSAEYEELLTDQQSEYFGIGASIVNYQKDGVFDTFVTSVFPDSPAFRAGLRFGDKILAVNGKKVTGKNSAEVRDRVRGKKGTIAELTVERAETNKVETVEIRRNRVPQPSIPDAYLLRQNIGYVDMTEGFNYTTMEELNVALADLHEQGMKSLILDLRGNPGGILEQAVRVAEKFLPAGSTVVTQRGRLSIDNRIWKSGNKSAETLPLIVLVDEGSASASEIVAGAMQDYDRALIIGENTFGKGLVQSVINLPYGAGLTLTTAKYYTPSGRSIQRDYSNGNIYDYFNHKVNLTEKEKNKLAGKTVTGRTIYGGDGITPDEIVKNAGLNQSQTALLDPLFFFTREIAGGRVKGFENYKINTSIQYGHRIRTSDYPVSDELFTAFKKFTAVNLIWTELKGNLDAQKSFIKTRLRYNLATAAFGSVTANQVLIEEDAQVAKAVEALPRAQQLASNARKTRPGFIR